MKDMKPLLYLLHKSLRSWPEKAAESYAMYARCLRRRLRKCEK